MPKGFKAATRELAAKGKLNISRRKSRIHPSRERGRVGGDGAAVDSFAKSIKTASSKGLAKR